MAKPIRITVRGSDGRGVDAPTAKDAVHQFEDLLRLIDAVEQALSGRAKGELIWLLTAMSKSSPCMFEITPDTSTTLLSEEIAGLADEVVEAVANGLQSVAMRGEVHKRFPEEAMSIAHKMCKRVCNGLGDTTIDFSRYGDLPNFTANGKNVAKAVAAIERASETTPKGYQETSTVEGVIVDVGRDVSGSPVMRLHSRLDGNIVRCTFPKSSLGEFGNIPIANIAKGIRVNVLGLISRDHEHMAKHIEVHGVDVFEPDEELPAPEDLIVPGYTGGLEAVAYLASVRQGEL